MAYCLRSHSSSSAASLGTSCANGPENEDHDPSPRPEHMKFPMLGMSPTRMRKKQSWTKVVSWRLYRNIAVLAVNLILTIAALGLAASRAGVQSQTLYQGSCERTRTSAFGLHVLINILSIILMATSSYCCQVLAAPTREEVDRAHSYRRWVPIGPFNIRNVFLRS